MTALMTTAIRNSLIGITNRSDALTTLKNTIRTRSWEKAGKPVPPPHAVKQRIVLDYASTFGVGTFIETGTYRGDMVYAMKHQFHAIISIELSTALWRQARDRFRDCPHIDIQQGDSGEVLPQLLSNISSTCLFWLDGHYSHGVTAKGTSDTPVAKEIATILGHKIGDHVILIDDARCFDGTHDYPALNDLQEFVALSRPDYAFSVANDVIRIHPQGQVYSDF
jgi:hypothetical protein